jgi:hypothetical protein
MQESDAMQALDAFLQEYYKRKAEEKQKKIERCRTYYKSIPLTPKNKGRLLAGLCPDHIDIPAPRQKYIREYQRIHLKYVLDWIELYNLEKERQVAADLQKLRQERQETEEPKTMDDRRELIRMKVQVYCEKHLSRWCKRIKVVFTPSNSCVCYETICEKPTGGRRYFRYVNRFHVLTIYVPYGLRPVYDEKEKTITVGNWKYRKKKKNKTTAHRLETKFIGNDDEEAVEAFNTSNNTRRKAVITRDWVDEHVDLISILRRQ